MRGDVVVVRYNGHLGLGHRYNDLADAVREAVEEVIRKVHETQGLQRVHTEYESFSIESGMMSK